MIEALNLFSTAPELAKEKAAAMFLARAGAKRSRTRTAEGTEGLPVAEGIAEVPPPGTDASSSASGGVAAGSFLGPPGSPVAAETGADEESSPSELVRAKKEFDRQAALPPGSRRNPGGD
jgi:hypothetical protein